MLGPDFCSPETGVDVMAQTGKQVRQFGRLMLASLLLVSLGLQVQADPLSADTIAANAVLSKAEIHHTQQEFVGTFQPTLHNFPKNHKSH